MTQKDLNNYELNYVTANRFYVEIEGNIAASFSEFSGLGVKIKKETYPEGGVNYHQRVILGKPEFSDVTLKRGVTDDLGFWEWLNQTVSNGKKQRHNVNILLFNQAGETMQNWNLIAAVPIGWKAPSLKASANNVAIEELTLAYEGLEITKKSQGGGTARFKPGRNLLGDFF